MSLVGTRPPTVDEWDKYELHHRARLATKPGLTGMWQVSGRSNITDFEEVVKLDKQYISECSFVGRYPSTVDEFLSDEAFARKLWTGVLFNCKYNESGFWNLLEKIILRNMVPDVEKEDFNNSLFKRIGKNIPSERKKILEKTDYFSRLREVLLSVLNYEYSDGINFANANCHQFVKFIKVCGLDMDMWNSLLKRALDEKSKDSNRPASHFMIDPIRKKYLNIFCENFMVHCLEDSRASKCGGNYVLYAIDYDICNDNSIIYANQKDEFTAIRFIYDSVFQAYDCYFLKDRIKSYKCPVCNRIYDEKEVAQVKVKRCFECDEKLEEIIHKDVPISDGNYTEVEVKILGIIATLSKEDAMSAAEISAAVGCNIQKVAIWGSKVLAKKGLINIEKREARNYYYDKVD